MMQARIFKAEITCFCDVFGCENLAKWQLGARSGGVFAGMVYNLCDGCAREMLRNLPEGLESSAEEKIPDRSEGLYRCAECDRVFDTKMGLIAHQKYHGSSYKHGMKAESLA